MSKKSKARSKEKRKKEKAKRKAAMQALYEKRKAEGKNGNSYRARRQAVKENKPRARTHPHGSCGNPGCHTCYGVNFKPFLVKGKPKGMPQWMYQKWLSAGPEVRK